MSFTLDLFADSEPAPAVVMDLPRSKDFTACPFCGGNIEKCYEWPCEESGFGDDIPEPAPVAACDQPGFWVQKLHEMGEMRLLAARSFIEIARRSGVEHEALTPTGTDSSGQKTYDMDAVTRLANLMRGKPESLRPELKTEADWQVAIEGLKAWKQRGAL